MKARLCRIRGLALAVCAVLSLLPLIAGCASPQAAAQGAQAASTATAATVATATSVPKTTLPAATAPTTSTAIVTSTLVSISAPITSTVVPTGTVTVEGTPTPRPTPSGPAPDPFSTLDVFNAASPGNLVAKRDILPLDGSKPENVLVTLTGSRLGVTQPLTEENSSAIGVLSYDTVYREWNLTWQSAPISGTARPLIAANQLGGFNGGDLLRTGAPIFALRTTTLDGAAHLALFRWNKATHKGELLKMIPAGGGAEKDAIFDADLDVNVADLDDDGVYEVVADNVSGVRIWRWDGSKYVPKEGR